MNRSAPWSTPVLDMELSSSASERAAAEDSSGLRLALHSNRSGGAGSQDLYESVRATRTDPWSVPQPIAGLNTADLEGDGYFLAGGLTILFHSDRPGGRGGVDLYLATRSATDQPFATPQPLVEVNTTNDDSDPWLSDDLRYLVFASNISGNQELYEASR